MYYNLRYLYFIFYNKILVFKKFIKIIENSYLEKKNMTNSLNSKIINYLQR